MNTKRWTIFFGIVIMLLAATVSTPAPALAQSPDSAPETQRGTQGARILLKTAAEELNMTPRELLAELLQNEERSIADVANEKGVNPDTIVEAVVDKAAERLAEQVAGGKLTQEEADDRLETISERVTEAINKPLPTKALGKQVRPGARILFKIAAETLDMTPRELLAELLQNEERTIADVANEKGVNPDTIVEAVVDKAAERLAEQVAGGKLTQEEADDRLETIRERVTKAVNSPLPKRDKASGADNQ